MIFKYCSRRKINLLWPTLVGITLLFCSLLVYQFLISKGIFRCSFQSGCFEHLQNTAEKLQDKDCRNVCSTKECLDVAKYILSHMNQNVNPCSDFYSFTCGKYKERHDSNSNHSVIFNLLENMYLTLRDIIETSNEPVGSATYKLKVVYDSCMSTGSSEIQGTKSIQDFLSYVGIPNWPHLSSNFSFSNTSIPEILGKLNSYQEYSFTNFDSFEDFEETGILHNFTITAASPMTEDESEINDLKKTIINLLHYLGLDSNSSFNIWEDFISIERKYLELCINNFNFDEQMDQDEIEDDGEGYKIINCLEENPTNTVRMLCKNLESVISNGRILVSYHKDQFHLYPRYRYYFDRIYDFLNSYSDRNIANYIAVKVFIKHLKILNFLIRKKFQVFLKPKKIDDLSASLDRWKHCIHWIAHNMQFPLGYMFVEKMWPQKAVNQIENLHQDLINTTVHFILQQQWIGESKEKLAKAVENQKNSMHKIIDALKNESVINDMYKWYRPSRTNFVWNVLELQRNHFTYSKLNKVFMPILKYTNAFGVNAFGGEEVFLQFGVLLPPYFHPRYPDLINFANLGHVFGHEIGHAVYLFLDWIENSGNQTWKIFKERNQCLVDQYFNFELKRIGKRVLGNRTVSENYADNMGLKVVEELAEKYLQDWTDRAFVLPGLPYSPQELLYISFAQTWCAQRSLKQEIEYYNEDSHSPPEFRVKGMLQNSHKFSETFNCPKTSYMNLEKKCSIFD